MLVLMHDDSEIDEEDFLSFMMSTAVEIFMEACHITSMNVLTWKTLLMMNVRLTLDLKSKIFTGLLQHCTFRTLSSWKME